MECKLRSAIMLTVLVVILPIFYEIIYTIFKTFSYFIISVSKDWHHAGKDRALLCTECRLYYKKYGEERPVDKSGQPPPYLFKPVQEDESANGKHAMRTRRSKESVSICM